MQRSASRFSQAYRSGSVSTIVAELPELGKLMISSDRRIHMMQI